MNIKESAILIANISDYSEIIAIILFFFVRKGVIKNPWLFIVGYYFFCSFLVKTCSNILADMKINNMFLYHFLALIDLWFLFLFYSKINCFKNYKLYLLFFSTLYTVSTVYIGLKMINYFTLFFNACFAMLFGMRYLFMIYKEESVQKIDKSPLFYINAGILIYYASVFFLSLFIVKVLSGTADNWFNNSWNIQSLGNIAKTGIISYGILLAKNNG